MPVQGENYIYKMARNDFCRFFSFMRVSQFFFIYFKGKAIAIDLTTSSRLIPWSVRQQRKQVCVQLDAKFVGFCGGTILVFVCVCGCFVCVCVRIKRPIKTL